MSETQPPPERRKAEDLLQAGKEKLQEELEANGTSEPTTAAEPASGEHAPATPPTDTGAPAPPESKPTTGPTPPKPEPSTPAESKPESTSDGPTPAEPLEEGHGLANGAMRFKKNKDGTWAKPTLRQKADELLQKIGEKTYHFGSLISGAFSASEEYSGRIGKEFEDMSPGEKRLYGALGVIGASSLLTIAAKSGFSLFAGGGESGVEDAPTPDITESPASSQPPETPEETPAPTSTPEPTAEPTTGPSGEPTAEPNESPAPTGEPTSEPTETPRGDEAEKEPPNVPDEARQVGPEDIEASSDGGNDERNEHGALVDEQDDDTTGAEDKPSFTPEQQEITEGMGWYEKFDQLDIDPEHQAEFLQKIGPELENRGLAYWDDKWDNWGMNFNENGLSDEDLQWIHDKAEEEGFLEAKTDTEHDGEAEKEYTETEKLGEYTGELDSKTHLEVGSGYNTVANEVNDQAVQIGLGELNYAELQQDPEFRAAFHNLVDGVLDYNGLTWEDAKKLQPDDRLKFPNDLMQQFVDNEIRPRIAETAGDIKPNEFSSLADAAAESGKDGKVPNEAHQVGPTDVEAPSDGGNDERNEHGALIDSMSSSETAGVEFSKNDSDQDILKQMIGPDAPVFTAFLVAHPDLLTRLYRKMNPIELKNYAMIHGGIPPIPKMIKRGGKVRVNYEFMRNLNILYESPLFQREKDQYTLAA